ncbi:MAG: hypothetical protein H0T68_03205 [Gemmatimonadales bacterium]|nr:hypothetical protein [Gemmatimonadales bacterium]
MRSPRSLRLFAARAVAVWAVSLSWLACGDGDLTAPETGRLTVTTSTTGSPEDPDGYILRVDEGELQPIGGNAAVTLDDLASGDHLVQLTGIADNCVLAGENPRTVTVPADGTVESVLVISCVATLGSITITSSTTGPSTDLDGYTFRVDETPEQSIGVSASVTVTDLPPGSHTVALGGVAATCQVEGDNPRTVEVVAGAAVTVGFSIACSAGVQQWTPMSSGSRADLPDVWGSSGQDVFVVGELPIDDDGVVASVILHYDGIQWSRQLRETNLVLRAIWGSGPADVYAVGLDFSSFDARLLRYDGTQWSPVPGFTSGRFEQIALESVWGSAADDVFAVGSTFDGQFERSLIFHFDGSSWQRMPQPGPVAPALADVWGSAADDVYAVGRDEEAENTTAVILRYDGARWSPVVQQENLVLNSVWGSSASDVFAAGFRIEERGEEFEVTGTILHYDGVSWSPMPLPRAGVLHSIWGSSATAVFAVGDDGGILQYDGIRWTKTIETDEALLGVWSSSPSDAFAVGTGGTILHGTP